jgi:hypothetical protein
VVRLFLYKSEHLQNYNASPQRFAAGTGEISVTGCDGDEYDEYEV